MRKVYAVIFLLLTLFSLHVSGQSGDSRPPELKFPPNQILLKKNTSYMELIKQKYNGKSVIKWDTTKFGTKEINFLEEKFKPQNDKIVCILTKYNTDSCKELKMVANKLFKNNLDNQIIKEYLKVLKKNSIQPKPIDTDKLNFYLGLFKENQIDINKVVFQDDKCNEGLIKYDEEEAQKLYNLKDYFESFNCFFNNFIKENTDWIKHWLWYTNGQVRINPFGVYDPSEKIKEANQTLSELNKQLEILDKRIACCEVGSGEFEKLKDEHKVLTKSKNEIEGKIQALQKAQEDYSKWLAAIKIKNELIYELPQMPTSNKDKITWLFNYDASNELNFLNNEIVNDKKFEKPYSIWEEDKVMLAIHNIAENQTINPKSNAEKEDLKSKFEIAIDPWNEAFAESFKGISSILTIANRVKTFVSSPQKDNTFLEGFKKIQSIRDDEESKAKTSKEKKAINEKYNKRFEKINSVRSRNGALDELMFDEDFKEFNFSNFPENLPIMSESDFNTNFEAYKNTLPKLKWLEEQSKPNIKYDLEEDKTPKFYTKLIDPEKSISVNKDKNKVTYKLTSILNKDTIKIENSYTKYNLIKIYPTVGVGYIFGSRVNSVYDEKTKVFNNEYNFDNIEAYVGVKWYPRQMNITNDKLTRRYIKDKFGKEANSLRGNGFKNRLAFNFAFGVRHKILKNYIIGASFDLAPGVAIQGGTNIFFQNKYKLDNNQLVDMVEVPKIRGYVGISVDLGIASSLVKLFSRPAL